MKIVPTIAGHLRLLVHFLGLRFRATRPATTK
jgi:hypothetical protein